MANVTKIEQQPSIEVRKLHKCFGSNEVLKGVELKAYNHDVLTLIWSSGSGKNTFLRCINLLETPLPVRFTLVANWSR